MHLNRLNVCDLRIIERAELELGHGLNVITGPNASGKTSLLEAIYLLGTARSFRSSQIEPVIRWGAAKVLVTGRVMRADGTTARLGVERDGRRSSIHVDGLAVSGAANLASRLPLQIVTPESRRLLDGGPRYRRRFVDWGVFHVEPRFLPVWQRYVRALKQRNAALRRNSATSSWDVQMEAAAAELDAMRRQYTADLVPLARQYLSRLAALDDVGLDYRPGWDTARGLAPVLDERRIQDLRAGYTTAGPHRADLRLAAHGKPVLQGLSRGQQKLLVCGLAVAQAALLRAKMGTGCVFLLDDLAAELDEQHRARLLEVLSRLELQTLVTTADPNLLPLPAEGDIVRFHVERGSVRKMVY